MRERTPRSLPNMIRRLRRRGEMPEAIDDTLREFLRLVGEDTEEYIKSEMVRTRAIDTRHGYLSTRAIVHSPTYATIETPEYMVSLSEGRAPYHAPLGDLRPWYIRQVYSNPFDSDPDPRYADAETLRANRFPLQTFDEDRAEVEMGIRGVQKKLRKRGTKPRRFLENAVRYSRRRSQAYAQYMARAIRRRFW